MTAKKPRPTGGVRISGTLSDVAIANGDHARASTSRSADAPVGERDPVLRELTAIRARLRQLGENPAPPVDPGTATAAEQEVKQLQQEILAEHPDPDVITRRLGRLTIFLGGVAGFTETLTRLTQAVGRLVGLG